MEIVVVYYRGRPRGDSWDEGNDGRVVDFSKESRKDDTEVERWKCVKRTEFLTSGKFRVQR